MEIEFNLFGLILGFEIVEFQTIDSDVNAVGYLLRNGIKQIGIVEVPIEFLTITV